MTFSLYLTLLLPHSSLSNCFILLYILETKVYLGYFNFGSFCPLSSNHPGRLWRAADLSWALWPVVYCWSDQLGTWMWANWFSRGLHSCYVCQEMDIYIPAFLKKMTHYTQWIFLIHLQKTVLYKDQSHAKSHTYCSFHSIYLCDLLVLFRNTVQSSKLGPSSFIMYWRKKENTELWSMDILLAHAWLKVFIYFIYLHYWLTYCTWWSFFHFVWGSEYMWFIYGYISLSFLYLILKKTKYKLLLKGRFSGGKNIVLYEKVESASKEFWLELNKLMVRFHW